MVSEEGNSHFTEGKLRLRDGKKLLMAQSWCTVELDLNLGMWMALSGP